MVHLASKLAENNIQPISMVPARMAETYEVREMVTSKGGISTAGCGSPPFSQHHQSSVSTCQIEGLGPE